MVQIAAVWIISVVAFFVLWALLANLIRRISEKKKDSDENQTTEQEQINQQNIQQ